MKNDPGSSYAISSVRAAASVTASTVQTTAIDHKDRQTATYLIDVGTFATSFTAKLQHSPDNSTWTDEVAGAGNTLTGTLTGAGTLEFDVPNPRARYTRLEIVLGGTCVFSVSAVAGPLLNVEPAATTLVT